MLKTYTGSCHCGAAPVKYADGRNNSWWNAPAETRHL